MTNVTLNCQSGLTGCAVLIGATLTNVNLTGANLVNAQLNFATFTGSNLTNANLSTADYSGWVQSGNTYENTQCPAGNTIAGPVTGAFC
jgi:uncharacterized protein YjbI with pentapeptide repeats